MKKTPVNRGLTKVPATNIWYGMIDRCYNEKSMSYKNYGGRGIFVCDEWKNSIEKFVSWALSNGWAKGLQLDRTDNNKGYSPENCRFVTRNENISNRRPYVRDQSLKEINLMFKKTEKIILPEFKNWFLPLEQHVPECF